MILPHRSVLVLTASICGAVLFMTPHTTFAQTLCTDAEKGQTGCQTSIDAVTSALGGNANSVSGLTACDSGGYPPSAWAGQLCGMVATKSGSTPYQHTPYQAGDTVKCAYLNTFSAYNTTGAVTGTEKCAITHGGATTYVDSGSASQDTITKDGSGNITGSHSNSVTSAISNLGNQILQAVGSAILEFANFLLGISGVLFNLVMIYGVFQFGNTIGNSPGVLTAWGILRDLANMALLFGFIFMGVATILNTGGVQQFTARNALPKLIIFAVLMNFSLFACEAVIDISNALTSSMYQQAKTEESACFKSIASTITNTDCGLDYGIAGHIMQTTGLSGIWSGASTPNLSAVQYFMLALFATIGAIVFFAASIMLAIRLIVLTLLMVTSPIGFAGMAIPPLRKLSDDWWNRVFHQAFYAPIMLLLILISLKIADTFTTAKANQGLAGSVGTIGNVITNPNVSSMQVVLVFTIVIGFLVASLVAANRFGAMGASGAVNFGKKIVLGSYGGVAGFAGRRSIGAASSRIQKSYKSSTGLRSLAVRAGLDNSIIKATDAGKNAKFGSSKSLADIEKKNKEKKKTQNYLGTIKKVQGAENINTMSSAVKDVSDADLIELVKQFKGDKDKLRLISEAVSAERFEKLLDNKEFDDEDTKMKMRNLRYTELAGDKDSADGAKREDLAKTLQTAETAHLADLTNKDLEKARDEARNALAERDGLVKTARDAEAAYLADMGNGEKKKTHEWAQKRLGEKAKSLGGKDAGILARSKDANLLSEGILTGALSDDQAKAWIGNENLTPPQKRALEDSRTARQNDVNIIALNMPGMNTEAINKLKGDVLANTNVLKAMDGRQLAKIDLDKLNKKQADDIVSHVKALLATPPATLLADAELNEKVLKFRRQAGAVPKLEQQWKAEGIVI